MLIQNKNNDIIKNSTNVNEIIKAKATVNEPYFYNTAGTIMSKLTFKEFEAIATNHIISAPKVRHGLFAGKLPRKLREIELELKKMVEDSSCEPILWESTHKIADIAKTMGPNHPLYIAVKKYQNSLLPCWDVAYTRFDRFIMHGTNYPK